MMRNMRDLRPWLPDEDRQLLDAYARRENIRQWAKDRNRTYDAVRTRLSRLRDREDERADRNVKFREPDPQFVWSLMLETARTCRQLQDRSAPVHGRMGLMTAALELVDQLETQEAAGVKADFRLSARAAVHVVTMAYSLIEAELRQRPLPNGVDLSTVQPGFLATAEALRARVAS